MNIKRQIVSVFLVATIALAHSALAATDDVFVEVESGDTLFGVVRMHFPNSPSRWSLIENEVFINNPEAFSNNDKSQLRVGAFLKLPNYETEKTDAVETEVEKPAAPQHSLAVIGIVAELSGTPLAIDINNNQRLLRLGANVYRGDAILTEDDSAAHLEMNDGAHLYVRDHSRLVINDYSFIENAPLASRSIITLLKGGFRTISGLIGRRNPASVRFNTAVATIGIRGTDFALRICGADDCSLPEHGTFEAGDYSGVLGGEITITNAAGTTPVIFGEVVRTASPDTAPVPAPEAAALIFTDSELAMMPTKIQKPMNFFQWLHSLFSRKRPDQAANSG